MNFDKYTLKMQAAINSAVSMAEDKSSTEITTFHILSALLSDKEGIIIPLFEKIGAPVEDVRNEIDSYLERLPKIYGDVNRGASRALQKVFSRAEKVSVEFKDEYVSTAGTEASGTGNMKFMCNGALTLGTLDGANVEMAEEVGMDNIFIFGHTEEQIAELGKTYNPYEWVEKDDEIKSMLALIESDYFNIHEPNIFEPLRKSLFDYGDKYFLFADLRMYHERHEEAEKLYKENQREWNRKAILNIAASAKFSSDRTIKEYAKDIWNVSPCKVKKAKDDTVLEDARNKDVK